MRILMICDFFEPINKIGAVRTTEFAKCLMDCGNDVDVITLSYGLWPVNTHSISCANVSRINVDVDKSFAWYRLISRIKNRRRTKKTISINNGIQEKNSNSTKQSLFGLIIERFKDFYYDKLKIIFGKSASRAYLNEFKKTKKQYDVIYCCYGGFGSLLACKKIKRIQKESTWIVDLRDAIYYKMLVKTHTNYYKKFLKKHCSDADVFTFASNGIFKNSILPSLNNKKTAIITNGFLNYRDASKEKNKKMTLLYAGIVYDDRKFDSIFKAIKEIQIAKNKELNLEIAFYGEPIFYEKFYREACSYGVGLYLKYQGFVEREELLKYESKADMFIISSWNNKDYEGAIPGKLFEYMSFQKPIIGHVSGNLGDSEIKHIINDSGIGFCSDQIERDDYEKMFSYLFYQYNYFEEKGFCIYKGKKEITDMYLRKNLTEQLLSLIKDDKNE